MRVSRNAEGGVKVCEEREATHMSTRVALRPTPSTRADMKKNPLIETYMSPFAFTIGRDQTIATAHRMMREYEMRHLPVLDGWRLVGIVSLGDIARSNGHNRGMAEALSGISAPGGNHSQPATA